MTNDSKLGMLAGVAGVIVAAVLFSKGPAQPAGAPAPDAVAQQAAIPAPAAVMPAAPPRAGTAALPSTPVARTRKEVEGQTTSLAAGSDEEP